MNSCFMLITADSVKKTKEEIHSVFAENSQVIIDISLTLISRGIQETEREDMDE